MMMRTRNAPKRRRRASSAAPASSSPLLAEEAPPKTRTAALSRASSSQQPLASLRSRAWRRHASARAPTLRGRDSPRMRRRPPLHLHLPRPRPRPRPLHRPQQRHKEDPQEPRLSLPPLPPPSPRVHQSSAWPRCWAVEICGGPGCASCEGATRSSVRCCASTTPSSPGRWARRRGAVAVVALLLLVLLLVTVTVTLTLTG